MPKFASFAALVKKQFNEMSKGELFVTGDSIVNSNDHTKADEIAAAKDTTWKMYLASFPAGTDPMFRERTEHDCSCCKQFIRAIGDVVSVKDGKLVSVWDLVGAEGEYAVVAKALAEHVRSRPVIGLFRKEEAKYGTEYNHEDRNGKITRWYHFEAILSPKHFTGKQTATIRGEYATNVGSFERGLQTFTTAAFDDIVELIEANQLYKGAEALPALKAFRKFHTEYHAIPADDVQARSNYVWLNNANAPVSYRGTSMGTLVEDFSEGKITQEIAIKAYEKKVAPENYKRPTAAITEKQKAAAFQTIVDLDLEDALQRRFAKLSDIGIDNVLWVDNTVQSKMKGGLAGLMDSLPTAAVVVDPAKAEDISIDDFMANILPQVKSMEVFFKNANQTNLVSLTAPVYEGVNKLFKWNNDFAWSYNGEVADSLRQRVAELGGRVDGVLRFTHTWNYDGLNQSLMDLHVFMPGSSVQRPRPGVEEIHDNYGTGRRVGWNLRSDRTSGGVQDVDFTTAPGKSVPVENITFPDLKKMPEGKYLFKVHNWALRQTTKSGFKAEIEFGGQVYQYEHAKALKNKQWVTLAEATLKNGKFEIEHILPSTASSVEAWGVSTEQFVKVTTVMKSPNHWEGNEGNTGALHWIFMLENCINPDATRGIYNEFLKPELDKHRKVFEILGTKTKCPPATEQVSGLGFTAARNDSVLVKVSGGKLRKSYNIKF
jgi:hypothetical protein